MLLKQLEQYKIYLVSKSPRRHQLLNDMGINFEFMPVKVKEFYPDNLTPVEIAEYLSQLKLSTVRMEEYLEKTLFIACDTIVVLDDEVIGKPAGEAGAIAMLKKLSGHEHTVISGLTVATPQRSITSSKKTLVKFKEFTDEEIIYYVKQYKPFDKAGAYGVQEWIGFTGIEYINGSFYNVMGLPTKLLWDILETIIPDFS